MRASQYHRRLFGVDSAEGHLRSETGLPLCGSVCVPTGELTIELQALIDYASRAGESALSLAVLNVHR